MSAVGGGQRRPPAVLYTAAVIVALVIGAGAYVVLVVREGAVAEKMNIKADQIEAELEKARDFLRRHQNDKQVRAQIDETATELTRRVAWGPVDLPVGEYLEKEAKQAGIIDVNWRIDGGLKIPKNKVDDKRTPVQRLTVEPTKLSSSSLSVTFTSRYKEFLLFLRSIAEAPWPMELISIDVARAGQGPKLNVRLTARYLYE